MGGCGEDRVVDDQACDWLAGPDRAKCWCGVGGVGGSGGERQAGDGHGGDEAAGERLEDPGEGEAAGATPREGGGDLCGQRGHERGPGEPDHHGEGVDEGLGRDAVVVEGPADQGGGGHVVREGPADEVPQRPRDPGYEGGEKGEGAEVPDDAVEADEATGGHGRLTLCLARVPRPKLIA
jgi:hypothetical protein